MLKSTPLWPIWEKNKGINHRILVKNVCNTLPAFIHKNSRQGEEWPAKGKISAPQTMGVSRKSIVVEKRMLVLESTGDRQTVILLPRCRMMVGLRKPDRPHFFYGCKDNGSRVDEFIDISTPGKASATMIQQFSKAGLNGFG
jgi:hypothetical protein